MLHVSDRALHMFVCFCFVFVFRDMQADKQKKNKDGAQLNFAFGRLFPLLVCSL